MFNDLQIYCYILTGFTALAAVIFISLFFIAAPYGRHVKKGWGPMINNKAGWLIQEAPASLLMFMYFFLDPRPSSIALIVLLAIWQTHYFHRAFIYPFTLTSTKKMPLVIVISAVFFNLVNTYVQGAWLFNFASSEVYSNEWLTDPRFILGVVVFYAGYAVNKHSDSVLNRVRASKAGYAIPNEGFHRFVSSPNYFGELVTWIGWAVMTWSLAGVFFVIWTAANLIPRARSHHRWYTEKFPEYPKNRKIVIPFIY
jgi:protein-S-isoprenylcysteine O-methyltransferase Ste14